MKSTLYTSQVSNLRGVDKLVSTMLKKMPLDTLSLDFLNSSELMQRKDMDQVILKMLTQYFEQANQKQN